jgi:hypothetical protein
MKNKKSLRTLYYNLHLRVLYCTDAQAFSQSYDLAPRPLPPVSWRHTERLRNRFNLLTGEGEGSGRRAESHDRKKAWPSINHSILSVLQYPKNNVKFFMIFRSYGFWISALNKADNARLSAPGQKKLERKNFWL